MYRVGLILPALLVAAIPAMAADPDGPAARPNWDAALARTVAEANRDDARVDAWLDLARRGEHGPLLQRLRAVSLTSSAPAPGTEADVLRFTVRLAELTPPDVPPGLLDLLEAWPVRTRIAHEESAELGVPLYNIPAAARGVRAALARRSGQEAGAAYLRQGAEAWLGAYRHAASPQRAGFLDTLDAAPAAVRASLARVAMAAMPDPDAGTVAARAVLSLGDPDAVLGVLRDAPGAALPGLLRSAARGLDTQSAASLLLGAIAEAPAERAALAIAILAPGLARRPEVTDSLFELLADPALGPGAALQLARHPDPAVRRRLAAIAGEPGGDELGVRRARLALAQARADARESSR